MFLLETVIDNKNSLNFEDYLQESLILEEEWSNLTEHFLLEQHNAIMEEDNDLLNETVSEAISKLGDWIKRAFTAVMKFFKWLFQYIMSFIRSKSGWINKNKQQVLNGARFRDERGDMLLLGDTMISLLKNPKQIRAEALNAAGKELERLGKLQNSPEEPNNESPFSESNKLLQNIKDQLSDEPKSNTKYGDVINYCIESVSRFSERRTEYKNWENVFKKANDLFLVRLRQETKTFSVSTNPADTKGATQVNKKDEEKPPSMNPEPVGEAGLKDLGNKIKSGAQNIVNKFKGNKKSPTSDATTTTDPVKVTTTKTNIYAYKTSWNEIKTSFNAVWSIDNKVTSVAYSICRAAFGSSKIEDM